MAGAGAGAAAMGAMNRYVTLQALGDGTYGSVMLGQRVDTGEKVTADHWNSWEILRLKYDSCLNLKLDAKMTDISIQIEKLEKLPPAKAALSVFA